METFLGIGALALAIGAYVAYTSWLTNGIKPRTFDTALPAHTIRMRLDGFVAAVQAEDRQVHVMTGELRGR